MEKRKRAPGGGRKPGEFGRLDSVMSLRVPQRLRKRLVRAANQSGQSLSAEMIRRLNASLGDERPDVAQTIREAEFKLEELESILVKAGWEVGLKSKRRKK